uniref:Uncharacterized protein n=1 Tax=Sphaerodactylus townsendi TaxID=933632 RepID=A0ACB8EKU3_9SAUR
MSTVSCHRAKPLVLSSSLSASLKPQRCCTAEAEPRGPQGMKAMQAVLQSSYNRSVTIMEQFNPSLRNFISMGKNYEKALAGVTYAAKGYFDALVKMGELASESQGSKELGRGLSFHSSCWKLEHVEFWLELHKQT